MFHVLGVPVVTPEDRSDIFEEPPADRNHDAGDRTADDPIHFYTLPIGATPPGGTAGFVRAGD